MNGKGRAVPQYTFICHAKQDTTMVYTESAVFDLRYTNQPFGRPDEVSEELDVRETQDALDEQEQGRLVEDAVEVSEELDVQEALGALDDQDSYMAFAPGSEEHEDSEEQRSETGMDDSDDRLLQGDL